MVAIEISPTQLKLNKMQQHPMSKKTNTAPKRTPNPIFIPSSI
jgi:hypothetical protein